MQEVCLQVSNSVLPQEEVCLPQKSPEIQKFKLLRAAWTVLLVGDGRDADYFVDRQVLRERYEALCKTYAAVKCDSPQTAETYKAALDEAYAHLLNNTKRAAYLVLSSLNTSWD